MVKINLVLGESQSVNLRRSDRNARSHCWVDAERHDEFLGTPSPWPVPTAIAACAKRVRVSIPKSTLIGVGFLAELLS
jgi:hypothetical protein